MNYLIILLYYSSDIYKENVLFPASLELDRNSETFEDLTNEELWIINSLQSRIQVILFLFKLYILIFLNNIYYNSIQFRC